MEMAFVTLFEAAWWIATLQSAPDVLPNDALAEVQAEAFRRAGMELLQRLQASALTATGLDMDDNRREIPAYFWQDAQIDYIANRAGVATTNRGEIDLSALSPELRIGFVTEWRWRNITVPRTAVEQLWPGGRAASKTKYAQASVKACEEWLVEKMKAGPPVKRKSEYREEGKEQFHISGEAFNQSWANACQSAGNPEWSKPGRRRRNRGGEIEGN